MARCLKAKVTTKKVATK